MPKFRIDNARRFLDRVLEVPLYAHIGEEFESADFLRVRNVEGFTQAMRSRAWDKVGLNALNHHAARIIDVYGMPWFQKNNNDYVERIRDELDERKVERTIKRVWKQKGIPEDIEPFIDTVQWAYNFVSGVAWDCALGFGPEDSFHRKSIEPCLMMGHLPCGWSGRVLGEPKVPPGVLPWAGQPLEAAVGEGKLKVF